MATTTAADAAPTQPPPTRSRPRPASSTPRRRAVWVGTHGRARVEVVVLRECRAWTLCRVVSTGAVERMHPADLHPLP